MPKLPQYRALVRVVHRGTRRFFVVVPGWDSDRLLSLPLLRVPAKHRLKIEPDYRFHAYLTLGAMTAKEMIIGKMEFD